MNANQTSSASWSAFWAGEQSIYVSPRHLERHYYTLAQSVLRALPHARTVLDFGCGEALFANLVAAQCERLYLCESAPSVRDRLRERWRDEQRIVVLDEALAEVGEGAIDLLVVNSVVQYLSPSDLRANLILWREKLTHGGRLIVADILPKRGSAAQEAGSLLKFALAEGFFLQAVIGLGRTFFSNYPRLRKKLGLLRFEPEEMISLLQEHGFSAVQIPNLGHNQARMAFIATASGGETSSSDAPRSSS